MSFYLFEFSHFSFYKLIEIKAIETIKIIKSKLSLIGSLQLYYELSPATRNDQKRRGILFFQKTSKTEEKGAEKGKIFLRKGTKKGAK